MRDKNGYFDSSDSELDLEEDMYDSDMDVDDEDDDISEAYNVVPKSTTDGDPDS